MANTKVIIEKTIQYRDENGNKAILKPSADPVSIPAELAKEGLERGWASKPGRKASADADGSDGAGDGTGGAGDE